MCIYIYIHQLQEFGNWNHDAWTNSTGNSPEALYKRKLSKRINRLILKLGLTRWEVSYLSRKSHLPTCSMAWNHSFIRLKVPGECWPRPRTSQLVWKIWSKPGPVCGWSKPECGFWSVRLQFWQQSSLISFVVMFLNVEVKIRRVDGKLVDNFSHESDVTSVQDPFTSRPYKTPFCFFFNL